MSWWSHALVWTMPFWLVPAAVLFWWLSWPVRVLIHLGVQAIKEKLK